MRIRVSSGRVTIVCAFLVASGIVGATDPYPLDYFAHRDVIGNVSVSPDGKSLLLLAIPEEAGNPSLEIYDASNLNETPFRVNAEPMEITDARWAGNKDIVINLRQQIGGKTGDIVQGVYETRIARFDVNSKEMSTFEEINPLVENLLPHKEGKIILSLQPGPLSDDESGLAEAFRPRAYYEFDLNKRTRTLLIKGELDLGNIDFDAYGNPWLARGFDSGEREFVWYRRSKDGGEWNEFKRQHEDSYQSFDVQGADPADPDGVLVIAENGNDKKGLWAFNTSKSEYGELIYRRNDVDVTGVRFHSNPWTEQGTIVGVSYFSDRMHYEYFDEVEGATYAKVADLIPNAYRVLVTSRSRDGESLTIYNEGPTDPGTYYLIKDAVLKKVGSKKPLLSPELLAIVEYITYRARDGKTIPAFVTRPRGPPPYPLVVMPHVEPFVQETVIYDESAQLLANNGYLVLQPQYRGSKGLGAEFYLSAIEGGGQGGYKMQDDKDDGALHLVELGLADRDRMAMYGWSYAGYAALIAASRTPQIYQCVIAGAAISDAQLQVNYYKNQSRGHIRNQHLAMWNDSVSPIEEVENVNVPVMLVYGSADQRVPSAHARKYMQLLEKYGKEHKYVEIEGAGHSYGTLNFDHRSQLYSSIINYLGNDCGPGGL